MIGTNAYKADGDISLILFECDLSLTFTICFPTPYPPSEDFDCGDWLLFEVHTQCG